MRKPSLFLFFYSCVNVHGRSLLIMMLMEVRPMKLVMKNQ